MGDAFHKDYLDRYAAVLKVHSEKIAYSNHGDYWRRELYKPLLGDSMTILKNLELIRERCGIVGPSGYFLTNDKFWGSNRGQLKKILQECLSIYNIS